jgi:hypothetical protein
LSARYAAHGHWRAMLPARATKRFVYAPGNVARYDKIHLLADHGMPA